MIRVFLVYGGRMPRKPKHPCSYPGCPNLTYSRYCEEHERFMMRRYNSVERNPRAKRRYGPEWKRIRRAFLDEHPFCEMCRRNGRYVEADTVHHIRPLSEGGTNDEANLMALCHSCHSSIHSKRDDGWGRKRKEYTY